MNYKHVIASNLLYANIGSTPLIDLLELETKLPISDRTWLGVYQAKLVAGVNTRIDEDMRFIEIFGRWMRFVHNFSSTIA